MKRKENRRRVVAGSAVASLLIAAVVVGGWGPMSPRSAADRGSTNKGAIQMQSTLARNGVDVGVPAGWDSESFVNPSGMAVLRVGSFSFPDAPNDDVGQTARAAMGPSDVLVNIVDVTATDPGESNSFYRPVAGPLSVNGAEAEQREGYSVPAAVVRGVRLNGHNLHVSVAFGAAPPSRAQVNAANAVLRTLKAS